MVDSTTVARLVQEKFTAVSKHIKITKERAEWTVLAGIVISHNEENRCIALGSGTQCVDIMIVWYLILESTIIP